MHDSTFRCLSGCLWLAAFTLLSAAETSPPAGPAKTHVIFMGADLDVQREKKFYRVEDVVGSEFKIRIGQKEFYVPTRNRTTSLKVNNSLKLASASVQLDDLRGEETYTPANDPRLKFNARAGAGSALQAANDWSVARQGEAERSLVSASGGPPEFGKQYQNIVDQEKDRQYTLNQQIGTNYDSVPALANELALELAEKNFDAVEVAFKISSPVELDNPYMVVLVEFQPRGAKPGESSLLIHAKALDPIDAKPRLITMREGGLPVGFKLLRHEVHIYNRGREIATNASSKRVELTRAEAQQYLVIEHLGAHKGGTLPAAAVPGTLPLAQRRQLSLDQLNRTFYVKISKDGDLLGAYGDEACSQPLEDAGTLTALGDVFFQPALDQGKPVEGAVKLRLADI